MIERRTSRSDANTQSLPSKAHPPLPCGEGAGGEGRADAQPSDGVRANPANASSSERPSSPDPCSAREKGGAHQRPRKIGHGWAPAFGEERQKDRTRTKLRARRLRKEMTPAEKELWKLLRSIDGYTFRSQPAIVNRLYDFGCYGARLLIELDGAVHDRPEVQADDKEKTLHAIRNGFRVLRFTNAEGSERREWVISEVRARLCAPHPPTPSPQGGGGEEQ